MREKTEKRTMTQDELAARLGREIKDDPEAELLESEPGTIAMYDAADGRYVTFHVVPRTDEELARIVHIGPSLGDETRRARWTRAIADVLTRLDPVILLTLERILVVGTIEDCKAVARASGANVEDLPEVLFDQDEQNGLNTTVVGAHWFAESTAIVNVGAIRRCCLELYPDDEAARDQEIETGFWTTLLHEIRHDQADGCPYELPWLDGEMTREDAVEAWARETFENLGL